MTTLYNLTKQEAKTLLNHFNNDIGLVALALWNSGRASSLERGLYKAKRLSKFINKEV